MQGEGMQGASISSAEAAAGSKQREGRRAAGSAACTRPPLLTAFK